MRSFLGVLGIIAAWVGVFFFLALMFAAGIDSL